MTMWDDLKRFASLLLSHLREQKDLFLYKLILVNYGNTREASYGRLGERYFKAYKEGKVSEVHDDEMAAELDVLLRAEEEIARTCAELGEIKSAYATQRKALLGQAGGLAQRAGESFYPPRTGVKDTRQQTASAQPPPGKDGGA